jgi:glycine cleavage system H protein
MTVFEGFYFSNTHEWLSSNSNNFYLFGISDFAQSELGDVVYIKLPEIGKNYNKGEKIGEIESVKSVSEIYAPLNLKIEAVNSSLNEAPELINSDPYGSGYIAKIQLENSLDISELMDKNAYEKLISATHA